MQTICSVALLLLLVNPAWAEMENVEVGAEIRIRARYWHNVYDGSFATPPVLRLPASSLPGRPIGPFGASSRYDFDHRGADLDIVEHRTRLNIRASFSDNVSTFIEMESYDWWGEDFRSDYTTGADSRASSVDDAEVYQGFIEVNNPFDFPLRVRIGRQEIKLGKGWLVDDITTAIIGRSFDAIRLTLQGDRYSVDAFASKLAERSPIEEDGDIDFYGLYGTYDLIENHRLSAYWLWIRDARSLQVTPFPYILDDLLGLDDYDRTTLHTVGTRLWGVCNRLDYDLEFAYQFGEADQVGVGFNNFTPGTPIPRIYSDPDAEFNGFAGDVEIGYTFDCPLQPRVHIGGAYFHGEDNRDIGLLEWLNPFDFGRASVSFNRLFPGKPYSAVLEIQQDMSNFYQVRTGIRVQPVETITAGLAVTHFGVVEEFDIPRSFRVGRVLTPLVPSFSFWTQQAEDDIGVTTHVWVKYDYSDDLFFRAGWEHLFTGDAVFEGNFVHRYGLELTRGTDDDDADYFYLDTGIRF